MNTNRENQILEILIKERAVSVKDLAKRLYSSEASVRRDLNNLERLKILRRTHGGAVMLDISGTDVKIPFIFRELEQHDAKVIIAKKASEFIKDGDVIMLDSSSSTYELIPFLKNFSGLTVITNNLKTLSALCECGIKAYSTGGQVIHSCMSLVGSDALDIISRYNADIFFFSCRGLSLDGRLSDISIEENVVRRKMMSRSKMKVFLCNDKKIGTTCFHNLCHLSDVDRIISNSPIPEELLKYLKNP